MKNKRYHIKLDATQPPVDNYTPDDLEWAVSILLLIPARRYTREADQRVLNVLSDCAEMVLGGWVTKDEER